MTRIYLIRHAEAEGNLYRIAQGQANSNLTDRGWRQVRALERRFADVHIDAVYASDLYRTCATSSAIYKPKGLPLYRTQALREICVGVWEQRSWGEIYRRWPEEMEHFSYRPDLWRLEGAEEPRAARARVLAELRAIAGRHLGQTVAAFSHGYVLRMVLSHLQGIPLARLGETPTGDNTAVSLLEVEGDRMRVVFRDDNSHLKTPEFLAGERAPRRANALEPGLWFAPVQPEQAETARVLAETACGRADDGGLCAAGSPGRDTLIGYLNEKPVGLVSVKSASGHIEMLCVHPDYRRRGYGIQLLGQAVQRTRAAGGQRVTTETPAEEAKSFWEDCGFHPGPEGYETEIRFLPEFLSE